MNTLELKEIGLNTDMIDECFGGNKDIYFKFLYKFFEDKDYVLFNDMMLDKDYEKAFNPAHAIKGVAGNLGMMKIYECLVIIVEKLRHSNYDDIEMIYARLKLECDRLYDILYKKDNQKEVV